MLFRAFNCSQFDRIWNISKELLCGCTSGFYTLFTQFTMSIGIRAADNESWFRMLASNKLTEIRQCYISTQTEDDANFNEAIDKCVEFDENDLKWRNNGELWAFRGTYKFIMIGNWNEKCSTQEIDDSFWVGNQHFVSFNDEYVFNTNGWSSFIKM